jgi:hypothetical protein
MREECPDESDACLKEAVRVMQYVVMVMPITLIETTRVVLITHVWVVSSRYCLVLDTVRGGHKK